MDFDRHAASVMPNARLETVPSAGHLPMMDQTSVFNKLLTDFLSNH